MIEFERQMNEKLDIIDQEHQSNFQSFESFWDKKTKHYDFESNEILQGTIQEHKEKQEIYFEEIKQKMLQKGKLSANYLDLKYKLEKLSKMQRFKEAEKIKRKMDKEYERCLERNEKNNVKKIESLM